MVACSMLHCNRVMEGPGLRRMVLLSALGLGLAYSSASLPSLAFLAMWTLLGLNLLMWGLNLLMCKCSLLRLCSAGKCNAWGP